MAMRAPAQAVCLGVALCCGPAAADEPPAPSPTSASGGDQRLVFSADGSRLTGGIGGGGGSVTWVGSVTPAAVLGAGVEYQQISNAHWTTGNFSGSFTVGPQSKTHLYVEVHEGAGDIGDRGFNYSLAVAGVLSQLTSQVSVQLEERRIDIDTSHGNLPKLGLSFQVTPKLVASVSYADTLGGNLGTRLATGRLDYTGSGFRAFAGIVGGPAAPATLNLLGQVVAPGPRLREGFIGVGKALQRTDWLLIGDYVDVGGTRRTYVSLVYTVHLQSHTRQR